MREGFTTGSATAAAAKAAAVCLLGGPAPESVSIPLPPVLIKDGILDAGGCKRLDIPIAFCRKQDESACVAGVVKDGGDDPDATHGMLIEVLVRRVPPSSDESPGSGKPIALPGKYFLYSGGGIGRVTLAGLPVAVGEAAINPAPRLQIAAALAEAASDAGYGGPLHCLIRVPEGEKRARKTLNARLGILGGVSILGTRGTVRAFSHEAWKATILQGLDVALAQGCATVCLSTGRRSETALIDLFPGLPPVAYVQAADYAGFSLSQAAQRPFTRVVWGCFPGKLLKLAQGLAWTHAKAGEPDFALLAELARSAGVAENLIARACALPTALGALALMEKEEPGAEGRVLALMAQKALPAIRAMLREGRPDDELPALDLRVFSLDGRLLVSMSG